VAHRAADGLRGHARGAAVDPRARARGLLRTGQDEDRHHPPRPAALGQAEHLHRRGLGMGRIAGDTAIVVVLLGATLRIDPESSFPGVGLLRGTGGTLTSYVYNNSPAGEGNAPQKAYAAAFVLLLIVIGLNFAVDAIAKRGAQTGLESTRLGT